MSSTAEKPMELAIAIEGKIIQSNFEEFRSYAIEQIENINFEPETPDEFGQAKKDVSNLDSFEKNLDAKESEILKQMDDVNALITGCRELKSLSREKRLALNAAVKTQTAKVKKDIEDDAVSSIDHDNPEKYRSQIVGEMKGKRTLESLKKAANDKAGAINDHLKATKAIIEEFVTKHGASIAPDISRLEDMEPDTLREQFKSRVVLAKQEAENKRLDEERQKVEAELAEIKRKEAEEANLIKDGKGHGTTSLVDTAETLGNVGNPPKVDSIPVNNSPPQSESTEGISEEQEMQKFCHVVIEAFGLIKEPRKKLVHPENIRKAQEFADTVLDAYNKMMGDSK